MSGEHTPGPWFRDCTDEVCAVLEGGAVIIIAVANPMGELSKEATEANARLIAAAPDMRASLAPNLLRDTLGLLKALNPPDPAGHIAWLEVVVDLQEAAIAKAEGRS